MCCNDVLNLTRRGATQICDLRDSIDSIFGKTDGQANDLHALAGIKKERSSYETVPPVVSGYGHPSFDCRKCCCTDSVRKYLREGQGQGWFDITRRYGHAERHRRSAI